jgi:hypothetical protein
MSDAVDQKRTKTIQEAMVQNAAFFGFDLCDQIDIGGGETVEIMYRELLDADTKRRVDQVYREYELCDRQQIEYQDSEGKPQTITGGYKDPRERGGKIFDLDEQVAIAVWGQDKYDRYVKVGGPPGLVLMTWSRMRQQITRRFSEDSKSS